MNEYPYWIIHVPTGRRFPCRVRCYGADFLSLLNAWNRMGEGKWVYFTDAGSAPSAIPHEILSPGNHPTPQLALALQREV